MSKEIPSYLVSTRSHGGKRNKDAVFSECRLLRPTVENKIKDLDITEYFNFVLRAKEDDSMLVQYQIPVYLIQEHFKKGRTGIDLKPWADQISGATTIDNLTPRKRSNWELFIVDRIDEKKRYEVNSLARFFQSDFVPTTKKLTRADKFRQNRLEPIEILEEES